MKAYSILVRGRVQGVFYRASTKAKAIELRLKGWCRNEMDGSVYIHVEGEQPTIDRLIAWCQLGPQMAIVESCEVKPVEPEGFNDFQIRR